MQLMTFNSLLMFDIVFIFFLFLVGVTCLVYYLPPRELTPHDAAPTSPTQQPASCSAFPSPASGGPLVRGCASTARRISGEGGTPIILVGVRSDAAEQQQQQQQQQQELSQGWSPITGNHRYAQTVLTADSVRGDPGETPTGQPYPYPVRMDRGQQQQQLLLHQERQDEQEVLLLDCSLEDIVTLRRITANQGGEMRLPRTPTGLPEPCRNCCCQYQPSVDRWSSTPPIIPLPPTPPPRIVRRAELHYQEEEEAADELGEEEEEEEEEEDHQHRVQYVRIEIERGNGTGKGTGSSEPSMPACCYVRAKDTDIRACSGPIHDV